MKKTEEIRKALKEMGYNSRMVSVRNERGGYDSSITLVIRDAKVNYSKVEEVAKSFKKIDRCEVSQEILCGGNTYVWIRVEDAVEKAWASEFIPQITSALEELEKKGESYGVKINEQFIVFKQRPGVVKIWDEKKDMWMNLDYMIHDLAGIGSDLYKASIN